MFVLEICIAHLQIHCDVSLESKYVLMDSLTNNSLKIVHRERVAAPKIVSMVVLWAVSGTRALNEQQNRKMRRQSASHHTEPY